MYISFFYDCSSWLWRMFSVGIFKPCRSVIIVVAATIMMTAI